ncbi:MAG: FAD-binding protein [Gemmatimonadaceae bacterium]|nr:FAD-binding protein [Gemmatimonadaceae bacterium]
MTHAGEDQANVLSGGPPAPATSAAPRSTALRPRDAEDLAQIVADTAASGQVLRIVGGGTWLDAGRPVDPRAIPLDCSGLTGITEYVPGDLTLTARAATSLADIAVATAEHRQWLALDPHGSPVGTLGATLATASRGPLGGSIGLPRDVALGLEFVAGNGDRVRGGGRVVKNVAGFDLVRLQVGAWGTLGVITEATVRLRGRPEVDRTLAISLPGQPGAVGAAVSRIGQLGQAPVAAELIDATMARSMGRDATPTLLVRFMGNEASVDAQVGRLEGLGDVTIADGVWEALARHEAAEAMVVRFPGAPANFERTWTRACLCAPDGAATLHGTFGSGSVRLVVTATRDRRAAVLTAALAGGPCLVERAAPRDWLQVPPAATDRLSAGVRRAFDPRGVFNPGILGTT